MLKKFFIKVKVIDILPLCEQDSSKVNFSYGNNTHRVDRILGFCRHYRMQYLDSGKKD